LAPASNFRTEHIEMARKLAKLGAIDAEIADFIGVTLRTFHTWKGEHPELMAALEVGKVEADNRVKRSLYQRAVGYTYPSEKVFSYKGEVVRAEIDVHVPPDTTAAIFWLKNRDKENWRDVQHHDHTHSLGLRSDEEIEAEFQQLMAQEGGLQIEGRARRLAEDQEEEA
jgi:hypothetical protein